MADRSIVVRLRAEVSGFKEAMKAAADASKQTAAQFDRDGKRIDTSLGRMVRSAEVNREEWERSGRALTAFGLTGAAAIGLSARAAIDWESAWTGVLKTVDGTGPQLRQLESDLRNMALVTSASQTEIAGVAATAGQLGVAVDDVAAFTRVMIDMGYSTNLSSEQAAIAIARVANIMGSGAESARQYGNVLVGLGNNSATTESEIADLSLRLAAASRQAGLGEADMLAYASALSSVGVEAEAGGTALSKVFTAIADSVRTGNSDLTTFAQVAGVSVTKFKQMFERDAASAIGAFIEGLGAMSNAGESTTAIFDGLELTDQRLMRAVLSLGSSQGLLTEQLKLANDEWENGNALAIEAGKRYDTAEAKIAMARNSINDAAIVIGENLLPALASMADFVSKGAKAFGDLPDPVQKSLVGITGLTSAASLLAGGVLILLPRVIEFRRSMAILKNDLPGVASGMSRVSRAATLATAAMGVMVVSSGIPKWGTETSDGVGEATQALLDLADGADVADTALGAMLERGGFKDWFTGNDISSIEEAWRNLKDPSVGQNIDNIASSILTLGQSTSTSRLQSEELFRTLDGGLMSLVQSGNTDKAKKALDALGIPVEYQAELLPMYTDALAAASNEQRLAADTTGELTEAQQIANAEMEAWLEMAKQADGAFIDFVSSLDGARQSSIDFAQATADATDDASDSWQSYYDGASVSADQFIAQLQAQVDAQNNWESNLIGVTERVTKGMTGKMAEAGQAMVDELLALGPEGADQVALMASMTDEQLAKVVELFAQKGDAASSEFASRLESARQPVVTPTVNFGPANAQIDSWLSKYSELSLSSMGARDRAIKTGVNPWGNPVIGSGTVIPKSTPSGLASSQSLRSGGASNLTPSVTVVPVTSTNTTQAPAYFTGNIIAGKDLASTAAEQRRRNSTGAR